MNIIPSENIVPPISQYSAFMSCDDAAAFMHKSLKDRRGFEFTGFILSNAQGRYFCARKAMQPDEDADIDNGPNFTLSVIVNLDGQLKAPGGYTLEACLVCHAETGRGITESQTEWSQRKLFFSIPDLFGTMTQRRQFSRCYLSLSDGALISYASNDSTFEQELSRQLGRAPRGNLQPFESLYEKGAMPSSILILLAIAAGKVTTVVPGSLWRRRGALKASWRNDILQQDPPIELMPVCGPILRNGVEVAQYLHTIILESGTSRQQVGVVLKHVTEEFFIVTSPVEFPYTTFDRTMIFPRDVHGNPILVPQFRIHGFYHSAKPAAERQLPSIEGELYKNFFTVEELRVGLSRIANGPNRRLFLCTSDGAVLRFEKPDAEKVQALSAMLDPRNSDYQDIDRKILSNEWTTQAFVDLVAAAGNLSVLYPSRTWPKGQVIAPTASVIVNQ
ncbi:MAG TPA: hypothetical protein VN214_01650 [Pseudomonas sp.]|nr:hypothetical protein [Pseudomonas sp.]